MLAAGTLSVFYALGFPSANPAATSRRPRAYGQFGRIYDIIYRRKRCRYLDDIRSSAAIKRDPHPAYRITLDPRVYSPPERLTRIDILDFDPPYVPDTLRVIDSVTANGFYFKRIKDIKTPRRLTVRINRFNVQNQHHITAIQLYSEFVDHARMEDQWLQSLDLPTGYDYLELLLNKAYEDWGLSRSDTSLN
ncbi:hypothetical protein BJ085DRAFT_29734 [Dimargaris cristalligena]|uniref:Uncharacterized protein n=1 Tax=Dimargaris cristalligena TaxID=215637 RepID=A0A4V1J5V8_9FUNG|nr:hypothetical protein BJ085DRAFT_29734 [Dimargaris cristalligena]|eukprot:RKP40409.1 hypothetical protein BJ085DRAFT_29734 [Dimargaris cristalligena]